MTDLAAFLRARLDEDGHVARLVESGPGESPLRGLNPVRVEVEGEIRIAYVVADPATVLADVDAWRTLLKQHDYLMYDVLPDDLSGVWALEAVMRSKAAMYSDHADYREEWRP